LLGSKRELGCCRPVTFITVFEISPSLSIPELRIHRKQGIMNMNILSPPFYFHFHPLRVFFPSIPLFFFLPLSLFCLAFCISALSLLLQPTYVFLSSFLVSRSPGKGSYGSPHLLNTLLVLLPLHDWCCQPTLSLLHSFSLSAGSLTQGWIDVACGCYFSRPPGRQLIGAHHCDMRCKNKLL